MTVTVPPSPTALDPNFATRLAVSSTHTTDTIYLDQDRTVSMRWILLSAVLLLMFASLGALSLLRLPRLAKTLPVTAKTLLSRPEQQLYRRLVRAFPGHIIFAQVALSQLLVVARMEGNGPAQSIANRFRQLVADFVVCAPDFTAVAVLELDDRSHRTAQRERDRRKDQFLQAAGIKVIRVAASDIPSEAALRALVAVMPITPPVSQFARRA
jgi:very-short-patch-repair endonuclease